MDRYLVLDIISWISYPVRLREKKLDYDRELKNYSDNKKCY